VNGQDEEGNVKEGLMDWKEAYCMYVLGDITFLWVIYYLV
jgi:hypothetical protein